MSIRLVGIEGFPLDFLTDPKKVHPSWRKWMLTFQDSLADTEKFIQYVQSNSSKGLVEACITPRFVPTCTSELMKGALGLIEIIFILSLIIKAVYTELHDWLVNL